MAKKLATPRFRSEEEEARWYDNHHAEVEAEFRRRIKSGDYYVRNREKLTPVTIRMNPSDLKVIRSRAVEKGIPYQTYIRMLLRESIARSRR